MTLAGCICGVDWCRAVGFGGVEFFAEVGDDGVVDGVGLDVVGGGFEEVLLMPAGEHGSGGV